MSIFKGIISNRMIPPCSTRYNSTVFNCNKQEDRINYPMRIMHESPTALIGDMFVKVGGTGSLNISKSAFMRYRNERYFFNCGQSGESTIRGTISNVFVTHLDWTKIGGIISLIYKASSSKRETITLYGPTGLDVFVRASENFLRVENLNVKVLDDFEFESDHLHIKTVKLRTKNGEPPKPGDVNKTWFKRNFITKPIAQEQSILDKVPQDVVDLKTAYNYIITFKSKSAWVLSECVKRGVKPGEDMQKLWRGESVVLDDGSVIKPEDVIQSEIFPLIIVLDVPSKGFLDDLLQKEEYMELYSLATKPIVVIHFSPENIMNDERYISWMQRFPSDTKHVVVNERNGWETPEKVLNRQEVCRLISPDFFPQLISNTKPTPGHPPRYTIQTPFGVEEPPSVIVAEETSEKWRQEWTNIPKDLKLIKSLPGTTLNLKNLSSPVRCFQPFMISEEPTKHRQVFNCVSKTSPKNPKITFLGTGSQSNSAYRNSSGVLLELSSDTSLMLDCGDGMMHQLSCLYHTSERERVISSIKCIFLSHTHSDHHAGVIGLLLAIRHSMSKKKPNKILMLAPPVLVSWLETYHYRFQPILDNVILLSLSDMVARTRVYEEIKSLFQKYLGMKRVQVCFARHCAFSYCVSFEHNSGWKISFSGDTQYNNKFVDIGKGSDLLIHEATFGTGLDSMAKQAKHSTTKDAIAVGKDMCAKQIILTHFSKRYPAIPCVTDLEHTSNVSVAFDFLQCHLSDFHYLPRLNKSYKNVFANFEAENLEEHGRLMTRETLLSEISNKKYEPYKKEELQ